MKKSTAILLPLLLVLAACANNMHFDYETQQDFSSYQSYQIRAHIPEATATYDAFGGDIFEARLHRALTKSLNLKGIKTSDTPDFIVDYSLKTEKFSRLSNNHSLSPFHSRFYWNSAFDHYHMSGGITDIREYTAGTLTLKIIDAASNKTVWSSSSKKTLRKASSPETAEALLQERINKMLENFPPTNMITL